MAQNGIKHFVLLLRASIALDILKTMDASQTTSGWMPTWKREG
jgi:hypothetical protein